MKKQNPNPDQYRFLLTLWGWFSVLIGVIFLIILICSWRFEISEATEVGDSDGVCTGCSEEEN